MLSVLLMHSCCTQKDCNSTFDDSVILLADFNHNAANRISISSYKKNGLFTSKIDSAILSANTNFSSVRILFEIEIDSSINYSTLWIPFDFISGKDYKINFLDIDMNYYITDINTINEKCNTCFLTQDYYEVLSNYKVNDKERQSSDIVIYKND